jgi:nicotinamide mononucleotide transporter
MDPLESFAVVTSAGGTWLLAKNKPLGWWVGLVGIVVYAIVFYRVRLFAEVGIQAVYFVTSLQAIWIWLHGGQQKKERPVGRITLRWALVTLVAAALATWGLYELLVVLRGAVPFWDAVTAVMSLVAHIYLMLRIVENWWVWIAVDVIYIPLYASRGLHLTSVLYGAFLIMSIYGLINFLRIYREQKKSARPLAETGAELVESGPQ